MSFLMVTYIGLAVCVSASIRAFVRSGEEPKDFAWWDPLNLATHWRGALQVGGALIAIGLVGQLVT
jgi:hypothetical protein